MSDYAAEIMGGALAEAVRAAVAAERARREAAEAECARLRECLSRANVSLVVARVALADAEADRDRLRGELTAVRRAVRTLDRARAAIDANGQRVLRSLAGEERAALLEELAVARRERDDWNARATAMEAERDEARAALADAEAECARLRADLEATERARQAAEQERDTALELVAPDAVRAAQARDDRDAERLHALVVTRVDLSDARASHAALAAAVRAERAVRAEHDAAWAEYITADAGAGEVLAIDARLDAARAALDAALEAL